MNVAEMVAGAELDALIAEHVMGHHVEWRNGLPMWVGKDLPGSPYVLADGLFGHTIEAYSKDILAAWKVVDKIGLFKNSVHLSQQAVSVKDGNRWIRTGWRWVIERVLQPLDTNELLSYGHTPALAICRAALNPAVMEYWKTA